MNIISARKMVKRTSMNLLAESIFELSWVKG